MMRAFGVMLVFALCFGFFAFTQSESAAAPASGAAQKAETIKWTMKVNPLTGMVDLNLTDIKTGKGITNAKVKAVVTMPDGTKVEKEMVKMGKDKKSKGRAKQKDKGKAAPYMFSLDMSAKGVYLFYITGKSGDTNIQINVRYEVK